MWKYKDKKIRGHEDKGYELMRMCGYEDEDRRIWKDRRKKWNEKNQNMLLFQFAELFRRTFVNHKFI